MVHIRCWAYNKYSIELAFSFSFFFSKAVDYLVSSLAAVLVLISFFCVCVLKCFVYLSNVVSF